MAHTANNDNPGSRSSEWGIIVLYMYAWCLWRVCYLILRLSLTIDSNSEDSTGEEDSEIDENLEIGELEELDFEDDEEGIE
jgi:hypothetical protein